MTTPKANTSLAMSLAAIVAGMLMLAYASVPLYRLFCQATGFGGVAARTALKSGAVEGARTFTVRFDANVNGSLAWDFKPAQTQIDVTPGKEMHVEYIAHNQMDILSTGTAMFNVLPVKAGSYFNKVQCFCFTNQTLKPHETKRMGITFFLDPSLLKDHDLDDVHTITLSYTFFPVDKK